MTAMPFLIRALAAPVALVALFAAAPAMADGHLNSEGGGLTQRLLHPYKTSANYCPAGLQPIMAGGVICCGTPNTTVAYVEGASSKPRYSPRAYAPVGEKGVVYR